MLTVIGTLLPEGHILPKSMYEAQKLLRALKMPYEQIHACPKGCILFRKEYAEAKYCPRIVPRDALMVTRIEDHFVLFLFILVIVLTLYTNCTTFNDIY